MSPVSDQITVLIAGVSKEIDRLQRICKGYGWNIRTAHTHAGVSSVIQQKTTPVVVCETQLPGVNWTDILAITQKQEPECRLIVTARLADDRLWAEVLNLGGFNVLAQPFEPSEVKQVIESAWLQYHRRPIHTAERWSAAAD